MYEIETKAKIDQKKKEVEEYCTKNAQFLQNIVKTDSMYSRNKNPNDMFRIRNENNRYTVTTKKRKYSENGTEINEENEFEVQRIEDFIRMIQILGYSLWYEKQKHIQQFQKDEMLLEIVEIQGLGSFLEIEIQSKNKKEAEEKILAIIQQLNLENDIEPKPYGILLKEFSDEAKTT